MYLKKILNMLKTYMIKEFNKLVCNLYHKSNYITHTRTLKQALNHLLVLKNVSEPSQFNQKALLKWYIDMNTKLSIEAKNDFEKDLLKVINNSRFGKTMENVRTANNYKWKNYK